MKRKAKRIVPNLDKKPRSRNAITVRSHDGLGTSMPPSLASIEIYFDQKGLIEIANDFFSEHELREWKSITGYPIINWKVCAADWIYDYRQAVKMRFKKSRFYTEPS
ncbi:hypothetical protein [Mucilaginibacter flavus]|uniref:hypothetical protein n=1 Tax=Mucilaginibacter flavus TaxID=931504 RepID=UPI0025B36BA3|nr:hypothetical protein [Mucilaginibacter flavus]MDN3584918.1 hypothetical protein [Mucilaginibacter flavus]